MKLSVADKGRIWMALASYIEECVSLLGDTEEEPERIYYEGEIKDATELRKRIRYCQFTEE